MRKTISVLLIALVLTIHATQVFANKSISIENKALILCDTVADIPITECQVLEQLYNSTNGNDWTNHTGWLTTNTPCSWYGITCNSGHVQQIFLGDNALSGTLPGNISNLTDLEELNLGGNQIGGSIPPELGNLAQLQALFLNGNQLTGNIPTQLGSLVNLKQINLGSNQLTDSIPTTIGNWMNLEWMNIENNHLSGELPSVLGNLTKITFLNVAKNQLDGQIPTQIGNLTALEGLDISNNAFAGPVPTQIKLLVNLLVPNTHFSYNALYTSDQTIQDFMTSKDPNWVDNQTASPTDIEAEPAIQGVNLTWTPIPYTTDGGYYEVSFATEITGTYTIHGFTSDKSTSQYIVTGLAPHTLYYFQIRTYTPAHDVQQNDVWSVYTTPLSVETFSIVFLPLTVQNP